MKYFMPKNFMKFYITTRKLSAQLSLLYLCWRDWKRRHFSWEDSADRCYVAMSLYEKRCIYVIWFGNETSDRLRFIRFQGPERSWRPGTFRANIVLKYCSRIYALLRRDAYRGALRRTVIKSRWWRTLLEKAANPHSSAIAAGDVLERMQSASASHHTVPWAEFNAPPDTV